MAGLDEVVTLVDDQDKVIGSEKFRNLTDDDRWRIVLVWVTDKTGRILLAKRADDKKVMPGRWEPGAGGTVTHGDNYETTALRELGEELGINRSELDFRKVIFFKSTFGSRAAAVYRTVVDSEKEKIAFQRSEITEIKWIEPEVFRTELNINPDDYVIESKTLWEICHG